MDRVFEVLYTP